MAGVDLGVVGQAEQPLDDAGTKLLVVAAREVGAADAAAEECIPSEDPAFDLGIETNATDGVAWRADDFQGTLPHFDGFSVLQIDVGQFAVARKRHPEHRGLLSRAEEVVLHVGMRRHFDAVALFHGGIAYNMVDVTMRVDYHQRLEVVAVDKAKEFIFLTCIGAAWVNDDAFEGVVVKDVGVFAKKIENEGFEFEHCV